MIFSSQQVKEFVRINPNIVVIVNEGYVPSCRDFQSNISRSSRSCTTTDARIFNLYALPQ
jgi:hypothetical protein